MLKHALTAPKRALTVLKLQASVLEPHPIALKHRPAVPKRRLVVLKPRSTVPKHHPTVLRHRSAVLKNRPTALGNRPLLSRTMLRSRYFLQKMPLTVPIWYINFTFLTHPGIPYLFQCEFEHTKHMADYIPRDRDARFNWLGTFRTDLTTNAAALGFSPADVAEVDALWAPYDAAYTALPPKENAYNAALTSLNGEEETIIDHIRGMVGEIQANPDVSDALRTTIGLPIRKTTRTASAVPTTRPVAEVDTSQRLQHTISFRNEGATDRAKPAGVRGSEIWCVVGPGPATVADARYLATDTASPYLATFDAADAGKTVHYFLRWVNTRNEPGPWSETVAATIGG